MTTWMTVVLEGREEDLPLNRHGAMQAMTYGAVLELPAAQALFPNGWKIWVSSVTVEPKDTHWWLRVTITAAPLWEATE